MALEQRHRCITVIKRIELSNFMSHQHTAIEPSDGLTVLVGPNNCGKSAFVTALQILCHNASSGFVMRHGEKKCMVSVETTDGHVITWSRKKNGAASYNIDGQTFDRLRGKVPDEVHQILKMPKVQCDKDDFDIHFGEQSEPVFLLRNRGKASAQFFASSSDATHLVAMQNRHKSNVTFAKRDHKQLSDKKLTLEKRLEILDPVDDLEKQLTQCEQQFEQLESNAAKLEHLNILTEAIKESQRKIELANAKIAAFKALESPPALPDPRPLQQLVLQTRRTMRRHALALACSKPLQQIPSSPKFSDDRSLQRLTCNLRDIESRSAYLVKTCQPLNALKTPPSLAHTQTFADVLTRLRSAKQKHRLADACATAFKETPTPPSLKNESLLQILTTDLRKLESNFKQKTALTKTLTNVPAPPAKKNTLSIQETTQKLRTLADAIQSKQQQIKKTDSELEALQQDFAAWVTANPTCPTCGSSTDTEHVLGNRRTDHG